jgi:hypothetical protein
MSRNTKILLGVFFGVAAMIFLCGGVFVFGAGTLALNGIAQSVEYDRAAVSAQAAAIADFTFPDGYQPTLSWHAGGFNLVSYDPGDNHSHLMLVQAPAWVKLDQSQFEKQLRRDFGEKLNWADDPKSKIVDRRTLRVAGQPVEFALSEGVNSEGGDYRSMAGVWEGPNGQVLIYIEEPVSRWNQAEIDAFIASIH